MMDQDALNLEFHKKNKRMPLRFNHAFQKDEFESLEKVEREVYHYACEVLSMNCHNIFNRLWFSYFIKTPFCTTQTFTNLFDEVQRFSTRKNLLWQKFSQLSEIRKRAFWNDDNKYTELTNFFGTTSGDVMINVSRPNAFQNLLKMMQREKGKFIFILDLYHEKYYRLRFQLNQCGFEENEDFFYAQDFMNDHSSITGRNLVKEM